MTDPYLVALSFFILYTLLMSDCTTTFLGKTAELEFWRLSILNQVPEPRAIEFVRTAEVIGGMCVCSKLPLARSNIFAWSERRGIIWLIALKLTNNFPVGTGKGCMAYNFIYGLLLVHGNALLVYQLMWRNIGWYRKACTSLPMRGESIEPKPSTLECPPKRRSAGENVRYRWFVRWRGISPDKLDCLENRKTIPCRIVMKRMYYIRAAQLLSITLTLR